MASRWTGAKRGSRPLHNRQTSGIIGTGRYQAGEALPMSETLDGNGGHATPEPRKRDWRKGMSDNIAYALLVYTGLQIWVTVEAIKHDIASSILPYLALIVLVAAIIPACRWFEKRWQDIGEVAAADPELEPAYKRDRLMLWLLAIGLPFVLTGLFKAIIAIF